MFAVTTVSGVPVLHLAPGLTCGGLLGKEPFFQELETFNHLFISLPFLTTGLSSI